MAEHTDARVFEWILGFVAFAVTAVTSFLARWVWKQEKDVQQLKDENTHLHQSLNAAQIEIAAMRRVAFQNKQGVAQMAVRFEMAEKTHQDIRNLYGITNKQGEQTAALTATVAALVQQLSQANEQLRELNRK